MKNLNSRDEKRSRQDDECVSEHAVSSVEDRGLPSGIPVRSLLDKAGLGDDGHVSPYLQDNVSFLGFKMDD